VANVTLPGAVYRQVHPTGKTAIDLAIQAGADNVLVKNFAAAARKNLVK
jgi:hypothetical protein